MTDIAQNVSDYILTALLGVIKSKVSYKFWTKLVTQFLRNYCRHFVKNTYLDSSDEIDIAYL